MSVVDDRLAATAAAQHALVTRRQVLIIGGSDSLIRRRLRSGRWERVGHGVYAIAGVPWTWRRRLCALWLSLDDLALVSHRAAAKLLGVGGTGDPPFEFTVPADRAPRPVPPPPAWAPGEPEVVVHESLDLHLATPATVDGMRVTAPVRLAVGLGSVIPFLDLRHESHGTPDEYVEILAADLLVDAGLPSPTHQFHVQRLDGASAYFDLAYPELRIGIETEGRIHLREDVHQADHTRRNHLLLDGWIVLHFTYADVTRRPAYVVDTVRAAIAGRRASLGISP